MVGKDINIQTKEHATKIVESGNNGRHLFLHYSVILLRLQLLAGQVDTCVAILYNTHTYFVIRCINIYIKLIVMVQIGSEGIGSY